MGDRMTEPFEPYRPESSYDYDDEEPPESDARPRILWGRVAFFAAALVGAFLLGRALAPSGVSEARYDELRDDLAAANATIDGLEEQLDAQPTPAPTATADEGEGDTEEAEGQTYTVQPDDTLQSIAKDFYGDPTLDDFLAEANDIADPTTLFVGQTLTIPPDPG